MLHEESLVQADRAHRQVQELQLQNEIKQRQHGEVITALEERAMTLDMLICAATAEHQMARNVELGLRAQESRLLAETQQSFEAQEKQARECVTLRQEHLALRGDNSVLQVGMESAQEWGYLEMQAYEWLQQQVDRWHLADELPDLSRP